MQLRLPRPKDAPARRKRAPIVSTSESLPCGICKKQLSRYTCPNCNLPYCSLSCFKAPEHQQCSEAFARGTLVAEVQGAPQEEREGEEGGQRKMLEMLRMFEEQQKELEEIQRNGAQEDEGEGEGEGDDGESDSEEGRKRREEREELEKRLEGVNLDTLSPEDLLSLLSPSQQAAFQSTLSDPNRVNKLVEEQFEGEEPWWIVEEERKVLKEMKEAAKEAERRAKDQGGEEADGQEVEEHDEEDEEDEVVRPEMVDEARLPPLKVGPDGKALANPQLVFNVVAVLFAYSYTLRTFALTSFSSLPEKSTERIAAIQVLAQLLPFLVERSTSAFEDMDTAVEYVVAREDPNRFPPTLVAMLLQDLSSLLRPASISAVSPSTSSLFAHSLSTALAALSDLYHLFTTALHTSASAPSHATSCSGGNGPTITRPLIARPSTTSPLTKQQKQQCTLAAAKIVFYIKLLVSDTAVTAACKGFAEQAENQAERREKEREEEEKAVQRRREGLKRTQPGGTEESQVANRGQEEKSREGEQRQMAPSPKGPKIVEL
ncbi:hypothetical protein JCM11251_006071 [Rhodosporidiobolus azoricus]